MSTAVAEAFAAPPRAAARPVTQARVVRAEWIKLAGLRSTRITLLVSFLVMAGIGMIGAAVTVSQWPTMSAADRSGFDAVGVVLSGYQFAQLAVGVLGVLVVSNEYSSGMIRATLAAVPRRLPVLWAKAGVFTVITLVTMTAAAFISFAGGMALLSGQHLQVALSAPGVTRAVIGAGLYLAVVGLLGVALGALLRNTAGAIAAVVGLLMVLPLISSLLGTWFTTHIGPYLPSNAGGSLVHVQHGTNTLSPWTGFAVMCGYAVAALALAAWALRRRDA
jgi:ABC-type transport system involved in multi-copper enzyme maturation permease subunit